MEALGIAYHSSSTSKAGKACGLWRLCGILKLNAMLNVGLVLDWYASDAIRVLCGINIAYFAELGIPPCSAI